MKEATTMPERWIERQRRDPYYRKAKQEKFRSRAAYKLQQLAKQYNLFSGAKVIVDIGCAPGSWLQVVKARGNPTFVLGVDLARVKPMDGVELLRGDIRRDSTIDRIEATLPSKADLVLADCSPRVSGNWSVDHARQMELARASLTIARRVLRVDGNFVTKVFQGEEYQEFLQDVRSSFSFVKAKKPSASRKESAELYVVAKGFLGQNPANP